MSKFEFTSKWPFFKKQVTVRDEVTGLIETFIDKEGTGFDGQEGLLLRNMLGLRDICLLYTSPSPRDRQKSRMPSSA